MSFGSGDQPTQINDRTSNGKRQAPQVGVNFDEFEERVNGVKVQYQTGGKVHSFGVRYYPGRFTDEQIRKLNAVVTSNDGARKLDDDERVDQVDYMNDTILLVVKDWDLFNGDPRDGVRYNVDDIIYRLEFGVKAAIIAAINKDLNPGEVKRQR